MDPRVVELHCIMPIANVPSVIKHGILSHEQARAIAHDSVAMPDVQQRRSDKRVPRGLALHAYANLYFHARNPMLYKRRVFSRSLTVLRISAEVLRLPGVVITDLNAASPYCRFLAPHQWPVLDFDAIFAMSWNHPGDEKATWWHRLRKCAEALVPGRVEPKYLVGAYVVDEAASAQLVATGWSLPIKIDPVMFFRGDP